jgi:GTP-binding protein
MPCAIMKIETATFRTSALNLEACPPSWLPEFAFVGRSNVGKSSLINMLTGTKELAKTSSVPGKTQLINFFEINKSWSLVDLPGYGYARLSKQKQHDFNTNVSGYLTGRDNLKHVFALIDSRLEPLEGDLAFIEWLQACDLPVSIIFTKADKSSDTRVQNHAEQFLHKLDEWGIQAERAFSCSAKTRAGRNDILQFIEKKLPKKTKSKNKISVGWMKKR